MCSKLRVRHVTLILYGGKGEACTQREVGVQFWKKNVGTFQSFNEQQWKNVMSALLSKIWHILGNICEFYKHL